MALFQWHGSKVVSVYRPDPQYGLGSDEVAHVKTSHSNSALLDRYLPLWDDDAAWKVGYWVQCDNLSIRGVVELRRK